PRPRSEPRAAVTLCPTVIVDGLLCASSTAPEATFTLPTTPPSWPRRTGYETSYLLPSAVVSAPKPLSVPKALRNLALSLRRAQALVGKPSAGRWGSASSASNCVALQDRPVKGSFAVANAMAQAPPLTVPPFQAVSGSYRMRHLYASPGSRKEPPPCLLSRNALHALCMPLASWPTHCQRPGSRARWRCRCSAGGSEPPVLFYSFYTGLSYHEEARIRDFYEPGDDKVVYWKNLHSESPRADSAG